MKHTIKRVSLLSTISMAIFASCQSVHHNNNKPHKKHQSFQTITLSTGAGIEDSVRLSGVLSPYQFVDIYPKVNGFVKEVLVDRGSEVKKGQVLIILEAPELEENVAAAKLKYEQANTDFMTSKDRYKRLLEASSTPGSVSPFDLEAAGSKMKSDSTLVQGLYANYKVQAYINTYLVIKAPFDGIISERGVHPGALVGPSSGTGKPMLVLQEQSHLRLTFSVPEQYADRVNGQNQIHYRINALPGRDFTGTIARSSGSLNDRFRSETIELDVKNDQQLLKPGMYAEVKLPVDGNRNAYVIPKNAVITTTERQYVIVDDQGKARTVNITMGGQLDDSTEVFGNLHAGDRLLSNGTYEVKDGQSLN